jgi:plasmid stabilization system protein ParE
MRVTLHPEAERDLLEAASFYERVGSQRLAGRFVEEFKRVGALISRSHAMGSPRSRGRRGLSMSVFPYTVIYKVLDGEVRILVVKHNRRQPGYGGSRS